MIEGKRIFIIIIALLLIVNLGCVRKIHVDSIDKPGEIYAGLIDLSFEGEFYPFYGLLFKKFPLHFRESNIFCMGYSFTDEQEYDYLVSDEKYYYYFIVVKGKVFRNKSDTFCWGRIVIDKLFYIVPLTKEEAFCLSQLELPEKEIEKLRDNPFKILQMCGIKKKPIKPKIKK